MLYILMIWLLWVVQIFASCGESYKQRRDVLRIVAEGCSSMLRWLVHLADEVLICGPIGPR